ncbi:hypothetical protein LguiB_036159 [Lonicera macranthoides]
MLVLLLTALMETTARTVAGDSIAGILLHQFLASLHSSILEMGHSSREQALVMPKVPPSIQNELLLHVLSFMNASSANCNAVVVPLEPSWVRPSRRLVRVEEVTPPNSESPIVATMSDEPEIPTPASVMDTGQSDSTAIALKTTRLF